jgi:regulator of sirC expression with transglutaminase-like and TPR domain
MVSRPDPRPIRCPDVRSPFADSPEFRRLLGGEARVSLPRIALEIARDAYPTLDVEAQLARIDGLARRVADRCSWPAKTRAALGQINWVLFVEEGLRGDDETYYDPRNSYLNDVLDRRRGIPISLSILYAAVAAPLGLELAGVNLPAHFVLRVVGEPGPLFVDAFHEGALLDRDGCDRLVAGATGLNEPLPDAQLEPAAPATVVARMLRNLKANYLREDDYASTLPVARRLAALDRDNMPEQRDWGLLAYRAGLPGEALAPLTRYLASTPDAADVAAVREVVRAVRRDVIESN